MTQTLSPFASRTDVRPGLLHSVRNGAAPRRSRKVRAHHRCHHPSAVVRYVCAVRQPLPLERRRTYLPGPCGRSRGLFQRPRAPVPIILESRYDIERWRLVVQDLLSCNVDLAAFNTLMYAICIEQRWLRKSRRTNFAFLSFSSLFS